MKKEMTVGENEFLVRVSRKTVTVEDLGSFFYRDGKVFASPGRARAFFDALTPENFWEKTKNFEEM